MSIRNQATRWLTNSATVLIFVAAFLLRVSFIDWDSGNQLHPDERAILFVESNLHWPTDIGMLARVRYSSVNPFRSQDGTFSQYPYGHLPLYLNMGFAGLLYLSCHVARLCDHLPANSFWGYLLNANQASYFIQLTYTGRLLSALFDTATVIATYWLARILYSSRVGLLAGSLMAFAVLHIQNAHFGTVDTAESFFATLTILLLTVYQTRKRRRDAVLAGIAMGLAIGSKFTAVFLLIPFIATQIDFSAVLKRQRFSIQDPGVLRISCLAGILAFAATNPYALLDPIPFVTSIVTQAQVTSGLVDWPFIRQYRGTIPILYGIDQQARWTLGFPLTVFAYAGAAWITIQCLRNKDRTFIPALIWLWLGILVIGSQAVKFPRYMLLFTPAQFAVATGWHHRGKQRTGRSQVMLYAVILLPTLAYALAFVNMYRSPHPWVAASQWIYESLPVGTTIVSEQWDDPMPLNLTINGSGYLREAAVTSLIIDPFGEPDDQAKLKEIAQTVSSADYIILSSNRLYGVIPRLESRYPLTSAYYRALFGDLIGYRLDRTFARYPNLFSISLVDNPLLRAGLPDPGISWPYPAITLGSADESFTVYDHPLVLVFKNEDHLGAQAITEAILQAAK